MKTTTGLCQILAVSDVAFLQWKETFTEGEFVIVPYNKQNYPDQIVHLPSQNGVSSTIKCMVKFMKNLRWPSHPDILVSEWDDAKQRINTPKTIRRVLNGP